MQHLNGQPYAIVNNTIVCPIMTEGADPQPIPRHWRVHCVLRAGDIVDDRIVPRNIVEQWPTVEAAEIRGETVMVPVVGEDDQRITQDVVVGQTAPKIIGGEHIILNPARDDTPETALAKFAEASAPEPASLTRWVVPKLAVVERLEAASLRLAAKTALAQDDYQQDRWDAATGIASDDEAVRALLASIGADPDAILARP